MQRADQPIWLRVVQPVREEEATVRSRMRAISALAAARTDDRCGGRAWSLLRRPHVRRRSRH